MIHLFPKLILICLTTVLLMKQAYLVRLIVVAILANRLSKLNTLSVSQQVGCSVVGVASPAGRFTGLVCSLGVMVHAFFKSVELIN